MKTLLVAGAVCVFACARGGDVKPRSDSASPAVVSTVRPDEPKSELDAFGEQTGVLLSDRYSSLGHIAGRYQGEDLEISAVTTSTPAGDVRRGVLVRLKQSGTPKDIEKSFTIDADEVQPLSDAIEQMVKANAGTFKHFEAYFITRSGLRIAAFSTERGENMAVVSVQDVDKEEETPRIYLSYGDLERVRQLLLEAKKLADSAGR